MSKTKRPYNEVIPIAQHIVNELSQFCERMEIAGSLRRQRPLIGDIEIVAIPRYQKDLFGQPKTDIDTELDSFLQSKLKPKQLTKNGRKYKQFQYGRYQVDLFLATPENWGNILAIRTGSSDFSKWLVTSQAGGGAMPLGIRQQDGFLWRGNERIACYEELDFFNALGLPFVELDKRDDKAWLKNDFKEVVQK